MTEPYRQPTCLQLAKIAGLHQQILGLKERLTIQAADLSTAENGAQLQWRAAQIAETSRRLEDATLALYQAENA